MNNNNRKIYTFICLSIVLVTYVLIKHESLLETTNLLKKINLDGLKARSLNDIILNDASWTEVFKSSKHQSKIKPEVILQTLKFMVQEVDEEDPKLIEFVKSLIYSPSTKPLNLSNPNRKDFSQFGEAAFVDQLYGGKKNGFLIEAGALDGEQLSNSLFLERERNWNGILIEPVPTAFETLLTKNRKMYALNACIARKTPLVAKFKMGIDENLSGRNSEMSNVQHDRVKGRFDFIYVPCFSLNTILKAIGVNRVDFFSLDLEGGEWDVLSSLDLNKIDFRFFLIEWFGEADKKDRMVNYLLKYNYVLKKTDHANIYMMKNL